ncbi:MAG: hypothetical protein LLG37_09735 [Spirochaetia bacterium]|nr:hypothetical protein [Spirochaetia bacterium]
MADEMGKQGPKDTTPNPMSDAEQKTQPAEAAAHGAETPAAEVPAQSSEPESPPLINAKASDTILFFILVVAGIFGVVFGLHGKDIEPWPAVIGAALLSFAMFFSVNMQKKYVKQPEQAAQITRYALCGLFALMALFFFAQVFKKFDMKLNGTILMIGLIAFAVLFTVDFLLYVRKNKENLLADIYMFVATVLAGGAACLFFQYLVIPAFILAVASMVLLVMSISKAKLTEDDFRGLPALISIIFVIAILIYGLTIFYYNGIGVTYYAKLSPSYRTKPVNLTWSGDSWSFAFNVFGNKKKVSTVNIINSLTMGMTSLPPNMKLEISEEAQMKGVINPPQNMEKLEKAGKNLMEKVSLKKTDNNKTEEKDAETIKAEKDIENAQAILAKKAAEESLKLPKFVDAPYFNNKGNMLIFTAGDDEKGPRSIWGVALSINLYQTPEDEEFEKAEKEHEQDMLRRYGEEAAMRILKEKAEKRKALYDKNMPVGKPKVLLADMNQIIDREIEPITHKTAWSPDGRNFCFAAKDDKGVLNIYTSNIQEQSLTQLTKGDKKIMPLWSPAGDRVLYVSKTDSYTYLKVSDDDGRNAHELNPASERDKALFPLWNSQESKVIYLKKGKMVIVNADATEQEGLSRETLTPSPYWLTESKRKVKLEYTESGNIWRIWTINPDGKKNRQIFEEICESLTQPKWSYDGKSVVVGVNYGSESSLYRLGKDGEFKTRLYTSKHSISQLEWSPTSERIAFLVKKKNVDSSWFSAKVDSQELWVINNDGTQPMALYESKDGEINNFSWNDKSTMIAFDETKKRWYFNPAIKVTNVKIVHAIGGEQWDLLPYEFYAENPTWSNDGQVLAYVGWDNKYMRTANIKAIWDKNEVDPSRVWVAQLK